jgi:hypothetical protein
MSRRPLIHPHLTLWKNLEEVDRLLKIHRKMSGKKPGYKHNVEVLNKSAVVLLVACWESFVEDLTETAFSTLLRRLKKHDRFSKKVLVGAAQPLKESKDEMSVWKLAGDGWRQILKDHKASLFERYTGKLNTPRPEQVDALYEALIGIKSISSYWHWKGTSSDNAKDKLNQLVELRGSIAHRVAASRKVHKKDVRDYVDFVNRISVETSNAIRDLIITKTTGKEPWPEFSYTGR